MFALRSAAVSRALDLSRVRFVALRVVLLCLVLFDSALGCSHEGDSAGSASVSPSSSGVANGEGPSPSGAGRVGGARAAKTPPTSGALFGAFVGVGTGSSDDFLASEKLIDRAWVIDHRFYSYEDWSERTAWAVSQQKVPLITWEPHERLDDILAGLHDDGFRARARSLRDRKVEVFLRWGHEMNGNWYPWDGSHNGKGSVGPAKYVAAYRHVHDLFVAEGATNVVWIWCPLVTDVPNEPWNHWTNYYPGDDYVDWVGMDAYNWGTSSACCRWMSFRELVADLYADYAGKKPIMIPETASAEVGGDKAAWISEMHEDLKTRFTEVRAVVWFHIDKETDWRIDSSPETLAAYKAMALDPYFNP